MANILLQPKDNDELAKIIEALKPLDAEQRIITIRPEEQEVLDKIAARAVQ